MKQTCIFPLSYYLTIWCLFISVDSSMSRLDRTSVLRHLFFLISPLLLRSYRVILAPSVVNHSGLVTSTNGNDLGVLYVASALLGA
ncbi:hypothetical protein F5B19DRAFT_470506 [Rostrohypoxylon terebratum]|nr:hypothetical protein F5B19DRAFT_470506 [Rostrohypoxylon terebratum]